MTVSIIVARDKNGGIGAENALMWRLRGDLAFFKQTTLGHSIIMGRKTFESLPKALPGRKNIVISRNADYSAPGGVTVTSPEDALSQSETDEVFIIGGEQIYKMFFPLCDKLYITEVEASFPQADAFFPDFDKAGYEVTELGKGSEDGLCYRHILYTKKGDRA